MFRYVRGIDHMAMRHGPWAMYNVIALQSDSNSVFRGIDFGIFSAIFIFFSGLYGLTSIYHESFSYKSDGIQLN